MVKAHLVNHTHWDREWYFTSEDAQVLSDQLFADVLKELESHPEANFTLDGQTSIVDEYVAMHPEDLGRIQALVARQQLFIGPWYTQTDAMIPDSESIIRNLIIGINDTRQKYGQPMMIGYLPDTFGFNAQLPMLLNQVGISDFICWRGTNFKRQMNSVYFKWQSLGANQVYVANFPFGYYTGQIALESKQNLKEFVENRLDPGIDFEAEHGSNDEVLLPSGIDQMNIVHNLSQTIADVNQYSHNQVEISDYPRFMTGLRQKNLPEYQGELRYPTYSRVHRTIGSVRSRIKRQNFALEQQILRRVEPLMVIAQRCGVDVSNGVVLKLWKKLLECQPHDTLGGSMSDNVAIDIDHRFKEGFEIADGIENYIKKRIAQRLQLNDHQVLVFNPDLRPFKSYKTIEFLTETKNIKFADKYRASIVQEEYVPKRENIMQQTAKGFEFKDEPGYYKLAVRVYVEFTGLGYQVVDFTSDEQTSLPEFQSQDNNQIQNKAWQVSYQDGHFQAINHGHEYLNLISLVDSGNDGDTYDYSPLRGDTEITLPLTGEVTTEVIDDFQKLTLSGTWQLPQQLAERLAERPKMVDVAFKLTLSLSSNDDVLSGKLEVDNQALDHRLRLKVNTGITTDHATAQIQGGFHQTENLPIDENWQDEFVEKPVNLYNFDKVVGMNDEERGLFLISKGMKEYELADQAFYVTLMATTGQLGKPNLLWRPGRASGDTTSLGHQMTPTPRAEELGQNVFEFGLVTTSHLEENQLAVTAEKWLAPSISYQLQQLNLFVNRLDNKIWNIEFDDDLPEISQDEVFFSYDPELVISALYPAYTVKNTIVLRLANESSKVKDLTSWLDDDWILTNALEETQVVEEKLLVQPYEMVTLVKKM